MQEMLGTGFNPWVRKGLPGEEGLLGILRFACCWISLPFVTVLWWFCYLMLLMSLQACPALWIYCFEQHWWTQCLISMCSSVPSLGFKQTLPTVVEEIQTLLAGGFSCFSCCYTTKYIYPYLRLYVSFGAFHPLELESCLWQPNLQIITWVDSNKASPVPSRPWLPGSNMLCA